jgi:hypothetical protein
MLLRRGIGKWALPLRDRDELISCWSTQWIVERDIKTVQPLETQHS